MNNLEVFIIGTIFLTLKYLYVFTNFESIVVLLLLIISGNSFNIGKIKK